jgi:hypothetical protein
LTFGKFICKRRFSLVAGIDLSLAKAQFCKMAFDCEHIKKSGGAGCRGVYIGTPS